MPVIRVGINGFGRIGRQVYREMFSMTEFQVVAINDLTSPKMLAHLLKYDTSQGRFAAADTVAYTEDSITVMTNGMTSVASGSGMTTRIYAQRDPAQIPWDAHDVDVVIECTGLFTDPAKARAHLPRAKRVVISAPATGSEPVKTIVYNVNHTTLDGTETVISAASCTTNCLAPLAQALDEAFGIQSGFMTTIHAYTNDQCILDVAHPKGDLRRSRAAAANIIPNSTGAAKAIGLVLPQLNGLLDGSAQRVPTTTGSLTELTAVVKRPTTVAEVNAVMRARATNNATFGYTEDEIVSSDVIGMRFGSLFDATQTKTLTSAMTRTTDHCTETTPMTIVKVVAWYDNEMSYVSQLIRTVRHFAGLSSKL